MSNVFQLHCYYFDHTECSDFYRYFFFGVLACAKNLFYYRGFFYEVSISTGNILIGMLQMLSSFSIFHSHFFQTLVGKNY